MLGRQFSSKVHPVEQTEPSTPSKTASPPAGSSRSMELPSLQPALAAASDGSSSGQSTHSSTQPSLHKSPSSGTAQGIRILFQDLTYTVDDVNSKSKLKLLDGISGVLEPHQMTALMGPSGSGKTTLLDVLAGRKTVGQIDGQVLFAGSSPSPAFLRRYTGYVEQFDTLISCLTVEEMLMYTAELKRPLTESYQSKKEAVARLITRLGLDACAHVPIGDPLAKGISGGQAKRTNIGIALIADPRVLFLDEPTSGLDSYSANEVMALVKGLARDGTTVAATIHSPSAYAFALFDHVLMLVRGRMAYNGPQGDAAILFARQHWPKADQKHEEFSAAEFLVDVVTEADRQGHSSLLADAYACSELKKENDALLDSYLAATSSRSATGARSGRSCRICKVTGKFLDSASPTSTSSTPKQLPDPATVAADEDGRDVEAGEAAVVAQPQPDPADSTMEQELNVRSSTATPWWWALLVLLRYRSKRNYTMGSWVGPRIADKLIFSLVILTLYLGTGDQFDQGNVVNLTASLFMWCVLPAFGAAAYVPSIVLERRLFVRERADGLYYVATYLAAKILEELGLVLIISIIFSSYIFYGVQYQGSFLLFWAVYTLTLATGIAVGYLMAALSPNMDVANAALPAYVTTLLFFAGQLCTYDAMPAYWGWYSRLDFLRYSWSALMVNQFEDGRDMQWTEDGRTVLEYYGMKGLNKWEAMSYLFAFFTFFVLMAYLALSFIKHQKR